MEVRKIVIEEKEYVFSKTEVEYIAEALEHALWDWDLNLEEGAYNEEEAKKIRTNVYIVGEIYNEILEKERNNE